MSTTTINMEFLKSSELAVLSSLEKSGYRVERGCKPGSPDFTVISRLSLRPLFDIEVKSSIFSDRQVEEMVLKRLSGESSLPLVLAVVSRLGDKMIIQYYVLRYTVESSDEVSIEEAANSIREVEELEIKASELRYEIYCLRRERDALNGRPHPAIFSPDGLFEGEIRDLFPKGKPRAPVFTPEDRK